MNYAIILSGGIGTRMQMGDFPKQYLEVEKKPILLYTLEQFQKSSAVEKIVIVAADAWREKIRRVWPSYSGSAILIQKTFHWSWSAKASASIRAASA